MHEPSDGVAEEVERQLQLALAAPAIAARRAIRRSPKRDRTGQTRTASRPPVPRKPGSPPSGCSRPGACARLFEPDWWETAGPQEIADMWQEANTWRDPNQPMAATPTIFDRAAHRIRQEVRDRGGLDPTQIVTLAAVQEREHEHQAALTEQPTKSAGPNRT